ncbi:hypothetical protein C8R44DRAFT_893739 [Mycena epipterygia]|nr:hypothetical protein C8R44DRAFT_893739 [Mycena epipterygia]
MATIVDTLVDNLARLHLTSPKALTVSPPVQGITHSSESPNRDNEALTVSPPVEDIIISYDSSKCNNEAWIRQRLVDAKEPVVFVGQSSNRSLPVALAIMRGSWDGISAGSSDGLATQSLSRIVEMAGERSQKNALFLEDPGQTRNRRNGYSTFIHTGPLWQQVVDGMRQTLSQSTARLGLQPQQDVLRRLSLFIDATRLRDSFSSTEQADHRVGLLPTRNIWFQCPWVSMQQQGETAKLLCDFLRSAATVQKSGDAIFLGLTAHGRYCNEYKLDDAKTCARSLGYEIFMDEGFIRHAIDAGYEHEGLYPIHDYILDYHQTFVFVKRQRSENETMLENVLKEREALEARLRDLQEREAELKRVLKSTAA